MCQFSCPRFSSLAAERSKKRNCEGEAKCSRSKKGIKIRVDIEGVCGDSTLTISETAHG